MAHYRSNTHVNDRLKKIEDLFLSKNRAFVFRHITTGLRIDGRSMTNVDFQANGGADITFDANGSSITVVKSDISIVTRLRTRRYLVDAKSVTIV